MDIEKRVDDLLSRRQQPRRKRGIAMRKRTAYSIFTVLFLTLMLVVSAGFVDYFSRVEAEITVNDVIFCDGEARTIISDVLSMMPCNTTNVTHTVTNIHTDYTYKLELDLVSEDTGLTTTYWAFSGSEITNITIPPKNSVYFNISYHVACNANASDSPYQAVTELTYRGAWK